MTIPIRPDVPDVIERVTMALGPPLAAPERTGGRPHMTWRWACPACGAGEDDPLERPLMLSGEGWFRCQASGCSADAVATAIALRLLPTRARPVSTPATIKEKNP